MTIRPESSPRCDAPGGCRQSRAAAAIATSYTARARRGSRSRRMLPSSRPDVPTRLRLVESLGIGAGRRLGQVERLLKRLDRLVRTAQIDSVLPAEDEPFPQQYAVHIQHPMRRARVRRSPPERRAPPGCRRARRRDRLRSAARSRAGSARSRRAPLPRDRAARSRSRAPRSGSPRRSDACSRARARCSRTATRSARRSPGSGGPALRRRSIRAAAVRAYASASVVATVRLRQDHLVVRDDGRSEERRAIGGPRRQHRPR